MDFQLFSCVFYGIKWLEKYVSYLNKANIHNIILYIKTLYNIDYFTSHMEK
jgi:hypothetical protein